MCQLEDRSIEVSVTNCSLKGKKQVSNVDSFIKDTFCFDKIISFCFLLRNVDSYVNKKKSFLCSYYFQMLHFPSTREG